MKVLAVVGLVLALAVGKTAAGDGKKSDVELIRGPWKVVSAKETAGFEKNKDLTEYMGSTWTFGAKEIAIKKGDVETKLQYALDPKKKPKEIDLGKDLNGKNDKRPFEGIYKLEGDKLTICYTVFNVRPTDFSMGKGIAAIKRLVVLVRQKKQ
jgi:uncharacterized protein (TIGR03067 family)